MSYTRWYDEDNYLNLLVNALEQTEDNTRIDMASDIIQLIFQNKQKVNFDMLINSINSSYIPHKRRWYDKNDTVYSAVEMMKYMARLLNLKDKEDMLKQFCFSLVSSRENSQFRYLEGKN